jgi:hypothetical protein
MIYASWLGQSSRLFRDLACRFEGAANEVDALKHKYVKLFLDHGLLRGISTSSSACGNWLTSSRLIPYYPTNPGECDKSALRHICGRPLMHFAILTMWDSGRGSGLSCTPLGWYKPQIRGSRFAVRRTAIPVDIIF